MLNADDYVKSLVPAKDFDFDVGDTVDVHVRIVEGDKTRIQIFNGIVIRDRGRGLRRAITVRRVVQGEGVERIFPLASPTVVSVKTKKKGKVRRAKLYYLREKVGKATKVSERRWSKPEGEEGGESPAEAAKPAPEARPQAEPQPVKGTE